MPRRRNGALSGPEAVLGPLAAPTDDLRVVPGARGRPEAVLVRRTLALAGPLEGIALAEEVSASASRIRMAIAAGTRQAALNETFRLDRQARACGAELRRIAGAIEGRPDGRVA